MVSSAARWLLTAVFAGLGAYCLARCALPAARRLPHALNTGITDALGVAMSATMLAMLWAVPLPDRWGLRLALFAMAGGWYLVRASKPGTLPGARVGQVHHGVAMGAMVFMLASAPAGTAVTAHTAMVATGPGSLVPGPAGLIGTGLAAYLSLAALWWTRSAVRAAPRAAVTAAVSAAARDVVVVARSQVVFGERGAALCQAVMASAMCVALLVR